jgi:hypothetical protein
MARWRPLGVLLALFLAQRTARIAGVEYRQVWNLCVLALVCGAGRVSGCCWCCSTGAICAFIPRGCWGWP